MHASNAVFDLPPAAEVVRRVIVAVLCAAIIVYSGVVPAMLTSPKTLKLFLYPALALYVVFCSMWVYTATYLQKKDIRWFESHEKFLYSATATVVAASFLWIIGMWPVYGICTVPLYMVITVFVFHLVGLAPRVHAKKS